VFADVYNLTAFAIRFFCDIGMQNCFEQLFNWEKVSVAMAATLLAMVMTCSNVASGFAYTWSRGRCS
jgi:hypothetical protein